MSSNLNIKDAGMTLIEAVIAIGIYTVLSLAISSSVTDFYKMHAYTLGQANEIENARRGMTQWNRDVKEMTTGADGTFPVAVIEPYRFGYYSDTDQDSRVEYIEYILATTTLTKFSYNPVGIPAVYNFTTPDKTEILSLYVRNIELATSTFFYFDNAGNELNSASPIINVRYVKAQIIVNIDPARSPGEFMLKSSVAPRNLKDNL